MNKNLKKKIINLQNQMQKKNQKKKKEGQGQQGQNKKQPKEGKQQKESSEGKSESTSTTKSEATTTTTEHQSDSNSTTSNENQQQQHSTPQQHKAPKEKKSNSHRTGVVREQGRGEVKSVPSGDTLIVRCMDVKTKENIEHTITISNIEAPRPSNRKKKEDSKDQKNKKTEGKDDPHAWPSREFLRHLTIGKTVTFIIEYRGEFGKEFGSVTVHTKNGDEDCAKLIVKEGWAGVKKGKTSPEIEELLVLEEQALKEGKGMHKPNGLVRKGAIWEIDDLFEKLKGKPQNGVVEGVRSGHQMRIALLPDYREVQVFLSGIRCPDVKPDGSYVEPFGREARLVAEYFCLNKDVTLTLESFDKMSLYGTVICDGKNIAEAILEQGLGHYVEWSAKKGQTQKNCNKQKNLPKKRNCVFGLPTLP